MAAPAPAPLAYAAHKILHLGLFGALAAGLALAFSATAIAMQSVQLRGIGPTDTGRATLVTLLVQDMAVIPILALIPVLAATRRLPQNTGIEVTDVADAVANPYGWWIALGWLTTTFWWLFIAMHTYGGLPATPKYLPPRYQK